MQRYIPTALLLIAGVSLSALAEAGNGVEGDVERGEQLYRVCSACHGSAGAGSQPMNAPRLAGQHAWYLERQLRNFRNGLRGVDEEDMYGRQMRAQALNLPDDQAVRDVVAYIETFDE